MAPLWPSSAVRGRAETDSVGRSLRTLPHPDRFYDRDAARSVSPRRLASATALPEAACRPRGPVHPSDVVPRAVAPGRVRPGSGPAYRHGDPALPRPRAGERLLQLPSHSQSGALVGTGGCRPAAGLAVIREKGYAAT